LHESRFIASIVSIAFILRPEACILNPHLPIYNRNVQPGASPFLTESVAKSRKRREFVRALLVGLFACVFVTMTSHGGLYMFGRAALFYALPFALILFFVRQVLPNIRMPNVGMLILFRSVVYTLVFFSAIALMAFTLISGSQPMLKLLTTRKDILFGMLAVCYVQVLIITAIRGMSRKIGPGAFFNWIRGYYYTPKEEERVFMFLDMRRSTELAESLGDFKFSKLVRDFFDDLTGPIIETRAEVSHYIGDEAVLTWWPKNGLPDARCLQIFFRMELAIQKRRDYYLKEYGLVPEFKAGAHIGNVVATEVGKIKSEIVFHGDVLNTTARVQGACGEFGSTLLITEALASRLPQVSWLELQPIGAVALKGKSEKVQLLSAGVRSK